MDCMYNQNKKSNDNDNDNQQYNKKYQNYDKDEVKAIEFDGNDLGHTFLDDNSK